MSVFFHERNILQMSKSKLGYCFENIPTLCFVQYSIQAISTGYFSKGSIISWILTKAHLLLVI